MPRRVNNFAAGHYYHIYNRGAGQELIFYEPENYIYCLGLVKKYYRNYSISVIAYCLMPNHYHFLFRQDGDIPLSKFVGVLFNAYVQAVNRQQDRSGTLFEDRFKHIHVDKEPYLLQLCRYIHANPVKAGLATNLDEWPYSNYREWVQTRRGSLVDHELVDTYFLERSAYKEFVLEYVLGNVKLPEGLGDYLLEDQ